ncbi:MAG: hypothetical protein HZB63_03520 [Deltaproteobacteria bacterium]|nr:hypothetical protein [Deltaproteobacteria bacterium]
MTENRSSPSGSALRNSLWNLLFRVVAATDHSRTVWTALLRGSCLAFFKEPIDELPASDNDASRLSFKDRFFALPEDRVYDLFEFLLADDLAGMKEMDRKLIRRKLNELLDQEGAPVRLLRDKFVPLPDSMGFDAVATAEGRMNLFDLPAASQHLETAVAFLSRRPQPAAQEAVREAILAVAAVVRTLSGGTGKVALGTVAPVAGSLEIPPDLLPGMEATLRRCHEVSGLPGASSLGVPVSFPEAVFLVVFCSSVVNYLLELRKSELR